MEIRLAGVEDVGGVVALEREVAEAPHWSGEVYGEIVAGGEGAGVRRRLLVATEVGELLGFAVGAVSGMGETAWGELESVAVRGASRRRGVGRELCRAMVSWCGKEGAGTVELEVRSGSAGAIAMYREMGFAEVGMRRGYYGEPVDDAVLMRVRV